MRVPSIARFAGRCGPRRRRSAAISFAPPTAFASSTVARRPSVRKRGSRVFQAALDGGCAVSDDALSMHAAERRTVHAGRISSDDRLTGTRCLHFLKPQPGLYARLSEMHDSGLLGQMFPEFKAINCRVVRDFYHKYTVDEHTLLTIRNLERLIDPARPERERFSRLLGELEAPELLVLALLLHDVGKWTRRRPRVRERAHGAPDVRPARSRP